MFKEFNTFIQPFRDKLENLLKYGKTTRITGTNGSLQKIQLKTLRNIEDALKIGQFGFNSKMPNGSRVVVAEISNEKIIIANEHIASIIDVTDGNTIIYNQNGSYIKLENDTITLNATNIVNDCTNYTVNASSSFTANAADVIYNCTNYTVNASAKYTASTPIAEFSTSVNVLGLLSASGYSGTAGASVTTSSDIVSTGEITANGVALSAHVHPYTWTGSGGSGNTGVGA
tara:strand:+ start:27 stop:716 length:690 start_codon:yes stop_codon:yes gene_type:complete